MSRRRGEELSLADDPADLSAWNAINEVAATTTLYLQVESGPVASLLATRANPADAAIGPVLDQLANAIATRRWDRLGACARCRRVFYDNTRSHTRRWCSCASCGNRANVAAYRTRTRR